MGARAREEIGHEGVLEEIAVQSFQRWIRASAQPIVGGVDWFAMRNVVLEAASRANTGTDPISTQTKRPLASSGLH